MERWLKIVVRKANIIYPVENFYCAGIVMSEASGKFRNTPPRVSDYVRAGRREPRTAAEKLSHNIANVRGGAWTKPVHAWEVILWVFKYSMRSGSQSVIRQKSLHGEKKKALGAARGSNSSCPLHKFFRESSQCCPNANRCFMRSK